MALQKACSDFAASVQQLSAHELRPLTQIFRTFAPHSQQEVNEKRYTTPGIVPPRRPVPAIGCLPPDRRTGRSFIEQRRLIADSNPDSALRLLEALPATIELTRRESARYALLLAQATDKCEKPLLPCDSLLDVALDYYDDDERERAVALLYKGRLEVEMEQSERGHRILAGRTGNH